MGHPAVSSLFMTGTGDPFWSNVVLLVPGAGLPGNAPADVKGHAITASAGSVYSASQAKFGGTSIANPSGDAFHLGASDDTLYSGTSQDWTMEAWIYPSTDASGNHWVIGQDGGGQFNRLRWQHLGILQFVCSDTANANQVGGSTAGGLIPTGAWTHVAATRNGLAQRLWVAGALAGGGGATAFPSSGYLMGGNTDIYVGHAPGGGDNFDGFIAELRVTLGVARYTSAFTPPTEPFPHF